MKHKKNHIRLMRFLWNPEVTGMDRGGGLDKGGGGLGRGGGEPTICVEENDGQLQGYLIGRVYCTMTVPFIPADLWGKQ